MFGEVIFWFCVAGAGIAALKHLLRPLDVIKEFTPVALRNEGKDISPEALWWGSIAFSAMNLGFFTVGLWSGIKGNIVAKQAYTLGTGVMFLAFALAWFTRGQITQHKNHKFQSLKIALFGALFIFGFFITN